MRRARRENDAAGIPAQWEAPLRLAVALAAAAIVAVVLWMIARPLAVLVLAIAVAQALEPIVAWLERRWPRLLAVAAVYTALIGVLALFGWLIGRNLVTQGRELIQRAPAIQETVRGWLQWLGLDRAQLVPGALQRLSERALEYLAGAGSGVAALLLLLFLAVYWHIHSGSLQRFTLSLWPADRRPRVTAVLDEIGQSMGGYLRGVAISGVITGLISGVVLWWLDVPYGLTIAVITGFAEVIPMVGPTLAGIVAVIAGYSVSPATALYVALLYVGLQFAESNLLAPNILQHETHVPAPLVLLALAAGAELGGLLGALAAIPVTAALRVLVLRVVAPAIRGETKAAEPRRASA